MGCTVTKSQAQIDIPFFIKNTVLESIHFAERRLSRPATAYEIWVTACVEYKFWSTLVWMVAFIQNLYRENLFFANPNFRYWSLYPQSESHETYEKFDEKFKRLYVGYVLDSSMRIRPGKTT